MIDPARVDPFRIEAFHSVGKTRLTRQVQKWWAENREAYEAQRDYQQQAAEGQRFFHREAFRSASGRRRKG